MNPWWLRPPAEEGPSKDQKPPKPARKTPEKKQPEHREKREKKEVPSQRPAGRSGGAKRRRSPAGRGKPKAGAQRRVAVLCDGQSLAQEVDSTESQKFDLDPVLDRLAKKGRLVAKRAYGDWRHRSDEEAAARAAGLEIVDVPQQGPSGRGSAAIKLAVDAVELCFCGEPCEVLVLISGDPDFVPLVAKLQEAGAEVIGVGMRGNVSADLVASCSEYLYYDEIAQPATPPQSVQGVDENKQRVFALLVETIESLETASEGVIWGSTLKQEMRRRQPDFDETGLGYGTFSDLLEDAERHEVIHLERDDRSGGYYVEGLARQ